MWTRVHDDKNGHKLYTLSGSEDLYVGDCSGPNPDTTDDGRLTLLRTGVESIVLRPVDYGRWLVATLPVREGNSCSVALSAGCAAFVARAWGVQMYVEIPYLGRVRIDAHGTTPLAALQRDVRAALARYDATGDHAKHYADEGDCVRCRIGRALV